MLLCAQANELEDQLDTAQDEQERFKDLWEKSAASYKDSERSLTVPQLLAVHMVLPCGHGCLSSSLLAVRMVLLAA